MEKVTFLEETPGGSLQKSVNSVLKDFKDQKIESVALVWTKLDDSIDDYKYMKEQFIWTKNSRFEIQGMLQDLIFEISAHQPRVQALLKKK
jgi:hypothetical protein